MRFSRAVFLVALFAVGAPVAAQSGKKVLTQADYDAWRPITGSSVSSDGPWVANTIQPLAGEGALGGRNTKSGTEYKTTRGFTGRPPAPGMPAGRGAGAGEEDGPPGPAVPPARFSADSKYLLFTVQPARAEVEAAQAAARGARGRGPRP